MPITLDINEPAINRGIKTAGIGKKGSQPLSAELVREILTDLKENRVSAAAKGAFFGALFLKGFTPEELLLDQAFTPGTLTHPAKLVKAIAADAPVFAQEICIQILQGETLDTPTAKRLGDFLLSDQPGDGARGMLASALRVRYETPDEYEGLLQALQQTLEPSFQMPVPSGDPVVQISEPFDGVDHSYLITPLLADHLQTKGFRAISLMGRNSGPKFGNNLFDVAGALNLRPALSNDDLKSSKPVFGWFFDQKNLSRKMDRWVDLRHQTIKRPFMSTLEKFVNPANARILITSAFHPPYTEKMITVAERAGFPGTVVVRNGLEGTLAFPLKRAVKIMCSARQKDGEYLRHEFEFDPEKFLQAPIATEEKLEQPSATKNARLIKIYQEQGRTDNPLFDERIKISCAGLDQAVEWLEKNIDKRQGSRNQGQEKP